MKKLLILTPHLSTGGAPQVTANKVSLLKGIFEIMVVEHAFVAWKFVVQRNRIIESVGGENFKSLGDDKTGELMQILEQFRPDVVSMEEFPEMFMSDELASKLYREDRPYSIVETTHDSSFNPTRKKYLPNKFVFVSPYNAIKYLHLGVEWEIIEYPVDRREQDNMNAMDHLGLSQDFKHVIIVGLFTPRKNQKYAFQLCDKLHKYKIKFHFLGNQADNFESYWKPLMEWKMENPRLKNCQIWGEREGTDVFFNAADMFLFPSRGDRDNKELNPIVIKEALAFPELPKLMYNLDVYLNRYHSEPNMHYLTGDVDQDANKIIEILNPSVNLDHEEVVIIGTYPNLKSRVELTKQTIESLKLLNRKIMLISHYPVDADIQRMCDFYIYDAENPLTHHSYYTRFFRHTGNYHLEMNINGLKHSNQSLTVLINLFTAAKAAKQLGYKRFFYTTYDVVLDERDAPTVHGALARTQATSRAYLGTLNTPFGKGIQTNGMAFDIDYFISTFDDVRTSDDYNRVCAKTGAQNFLEDYMVKKLDQADSKPELIHNNEETLLVYSGRGVASNSEYYSIVPIQGTDSNYMLYFYTYNVDDRKVLISMEEEGVEFYTGGFQISKSPEFKKEFQFNGNPIIVRLDFYDGDTKYKTEQYEMNAGNMKKYRQTGEYKKLNVRQKIKLVHIQTTIDDERERASRESLASLQKHGIEYVLHKNKPYTDIPPKHNCLRPQCVSMELFDEETVTRLGTALTPPHYGCFTAFKNAILSEFDDCDQLIICEGDCIIEIPPNEFAEIAFQSARTINENNIGYFSYGDTKTLEHGWPQSPVVSEIQGQDLIFITNHIIGLQCIMFPKAIKTWLKEKLRTEPWDASDIFFNHIFKNSPYRMGILKKRVATQANGFSLIDKQQKNFL